MIPPKNQSNFRAAKRIRLTKSETPSSRVCTGNTSTNPEPKSNLTNLLSPTEDCDQEKFNMETPLKNVISGILNTPPQINRRTSANINLISLEQESTFSPFEERQGLIECCQVQSHITGMSMIHSSNSKFIFNRELGRLTASLDYTSECEETVELLKMPRLAWLQLDRMFYVLYFSNIDWLKVHIYKI